MIGLPQSFQYQKATGDFEDCKVMINQKLDIDQYPLLEPDNVFATLACRTKFTKLDLSQAYQQVNFDKASKQFVLIL